MIRQSRLIAVVGAFLIGCAVLVVAGCAGVRSEALQEEQGNTEAPQKEEQARSDRCEGTRTLKVEGVLRTTNDLPGCPYGGLLSGTDGPDMLGGLTGHDEIRGLGGVDDILGGGGNDVIYGGPGAEPYLWGERGDDVIYGGDDNDAWLAGGTGEDVLYGGKGNDELDGADPYPAREPPMRDELYCGPGKDEYYADKLDYVDSSCEEEADSIQPPANPQDVISTPPKAGEDGE